MEQAVVRSTGERTGHEESVEGPGGWEEACQRLCRRVGRDAFDRWFRTSRLEAIEDRVAVIAVPNEIHQVWIETNYLGELKLTVHELDPSVTEIRLMVGDPAPVAEDPPRGGADEDLFPEAVDEPDDGAGLGKRLKTVGLNPSYSFDSFVVGTNSQFAQAACQAVATGRGTGYNPLFIHGGPGLGKTHLMQAVGQDWLRRTRASKVVYLTCEKFTNEFIDAVRKGDLERFRRRYRTAEVMLIDDVQFLGGKERSQEEFFHTFNTLLNGQCQLILTSDRSASEIKNLEPRLMSRFECGLTVELQPPGFETRLAILRRKVEEWNVRVDEGVLRMLAERIQSNVRRLEGGLMRVGTYASLAGERVTEEKVEHLLRDLLREEGGKVVTIDAIQKLVAERFDMRLADMTSRRRPASIAVPRQIAMYLSRTMTPSSLVEIGEAFGGRDHGTVIHAVKKVKQRATDDRQLRDRLAQIESELRR